MKETLYDWGGFNIWLFHAINNVHGELLDQMMMLGTSLGGHSNFPVYLSLTALAGAIAVGQSERQNAATAQRWFMVMAVFGVAYLLDGWLLGWLKPLLDFPRPPLALPLGTVQIVGTAELHHSLPSGHSSFAMLTAASLWPVLCRSTRIAAVLFVCWVGLSRISLGAHFPADVLAGFLSSLLVVLLVRAILTRLSRTE